ncbi:hypothetical protein BDW74DRAFT_151714 [Aspergillus multicolor]|uniref:uncharacterized protein n=1 Tax=Aspergillus multicolor TaxID=41759 RepID=UPI003CCD9FC0
MQSANEGLVSVLFLSISRHSAYAATLVSKNVEASLSCLWSHARGNRSSKLQLPASGGSSLSAPRAPRRAGVPCPCPAGNFGCKNVSVEHRPE